MSRLISLHAPSLPGARTVELVTAAAAAGFAACGIRLMAPPGLPSADEDLVADVRERARVREALDRTGVRVLDVELFRLGSATTDWRPQLDVVAELGAEYVLAVAFDDDAAQPHVQSLRVLAAQCAEYGLTVVVEPITYSAIPDVLHAQTLLDEIAHPVGVIVDALQFFRSGIELDVLASLPADRLPYLQLCDAPLLGPRDTAGRRHEARYERLSPGRGELPLESLLAALPADIPVSIEVPSGGPVVSPADRARELALDARRLLADL